MLPISVHQASPLRLRLAQFFLVVLLAGTFGAGEVARAQSAAILVYPANGAANVDTRLPFRWNAVTGAMAYRLQIGSAAPQPDTSSAGSATILTADLFDSNSIGTTSTSVPALPANQVLYARLWTQASSNSLWSYADSTFQAVARPATFVYPRDGAQYVDSRIAFSWTAVAEAQAYYLKIGTTLGGNDILNSGVLTTQATSYQVSKILPPGQTLYGRISTEINDRWWSSDISFVALPRPATFLYPTNGADGVDTRQPFRWTSVTGADGYYLKIGTTPGAANLVDSFELASSVTSYAVPGLPVGQTLYARIWTKARDTWILYSDVSFRAAARPATFVYPQNGAQYVDQRTPLSWTAVAGAEAYYLRIGTTAGGQDVVNSGTLASTVTTYMPSQAMPGSRTLYARISTKSNGIWWPSDITFQALPRPASLTYPLNGSLYVDTRRPFTWNDQPGAQAYYLKIGTAAGGQDLFNSGELAAGTTSCAIPALPTGQTLYARLWTKGCNAWLIYTDVSFQAVARPATFIYPQNGSHYVDQRTPFSWTAIAGAQAYYLKIGTAQGAEDVLNTGSLASTRTSFALTAPLPVGQTLYARISTKLSDRWWETDISFVALPRPARFTYPTGNAPVNSRRYFSWTTVAQAQGYYLSIGTTQGGRDIMDTGGLPTNILSITTPALPSGQTLYARLWTKASDVWMLYTDLAFTAQPTSLSFLAPVHGSTGVALRPTISWTAAAKINGKSPLYRLTIGSTPGGAETLNTGWITASTYTPAQNLPAGALLYGRVECLTGDNTRLFGDSVFCTSGGSTPAVSMLYPAEADIQGGSAATVDAGKPFAWSNLDLARSYRLQIYSGTGGLDSNGNPDIGGLTLVRDSNGIHVPRIFFNDLALGSYTARLGVELAEGWQWRTFIINVTHSGASGMEQVQASLWAVNYVRSMSDRTRLPYLWTILPKYMANWPGATCLDCRETLLAVLQEMHLCDNLPAAQQPRRMDITFTVYESHSLAEMYNSDEGRWVILDPTFSIAITRTADGRYATKEEVQQATLAQRWGDITYTPLSSFGDLLLRDYAIDYPQLYLNIAGGSTGNSPLPYLQGVSLPTSSAAIYCLQSPAQSATVIVDGTVRVFDCKATDDVSMQFAATSISLPTASVAAVQAYKTQRFVF